MTWFDIQSGPSLIKEKNLLQTILVAEFKLVYQNAKNEEIWAIFREHKKLRKKILPIKKVKTAFALPNFFLARKKFLYMPFLLHFLPIFMCKVLKMISKIWPKMGKNWKNSFFMNTNSLCFLGKRRPPFTTLYTLVHVRFPWQNSRIYHDKNLITVRLWLT